jgi:IS605 OrfB family transposase
MLFPSLRIAAHRAQGRIGHGHAYVANRRRNHLYKLSRDLVNRFGRIAVEDINIKALARGTLVKHVADAGWARLTAMLDYKAASGGVEHVRVDPRGTSQTCRSAGLSSKDDGRARTPLRMRWRSRAGTLLLRWSCTLLAVGSWPQRAVVRQASGLRLAWIRSRRRKATVVHNRCGAQALALSASSIGLCRQSPRLRWDGISVSNIVHWMKADYRPQMLRWLPVQHRVRARYTTAIRHRRRHLDFSL